MPVVGREELLRSKLPVKEIEVEGTGTVQFRILSVKERLDLAHEGQGANVEGVVLALVKRIARTLVDSEGAPVFAPQDERESVDAILDANTDESLAALVDAFQRVNGIGDYEKDALQERLGNSEEIPSEPSSTDSPGISEKPKSATSQAA